MNELDKSISKSDKEEISLEEEGGNYNKLASNLNTENDELVRVVRQQ
jgi:hypothetical protein